MRFTNISRSLVTGLILFFLHSHAIIAEEESEFNDLMAGFEDEQSSLNEDSLDELLEGFEEPMKTPTVTVAPSTPRNWSLITTVSLSASYNYQQKAPEAEAADYRGLSRLKTKALSELRYKFNPRWDAVVSALGFYDFVYALNDRDQYTSETLDTYESELEFRDTYIRGTLSHNFDIKIGRQIVVWGKSDSLRVVDILNPLDFREPGMVDIEDLRLPVTMFKADYYFNQWNLSAIIIPEIRFNKLPAYGSDFYVSNRRPAPETVPKDLKNFETALALEGIFSGWDLSFYIANYYDDQARFVIENNQPIEQVHSRLNLLGAATNVAFGDWLLKMESAFISGIEFATTTTEFSRFDFLIGLDYSGFTDTILSLEGVNRKLLDYENSLSNAFNNNAEENEGQIVFRYSGNFVNDKITVTALAIILGTDFDGGAYYRGSVEYEVMDATSINLGAIIYQSGDNFLLQNIAQNDRVFFDIRYSF